MIQGVCVWQGLDIIGAIAKINNVSIHSERGECTVRIDIFASPEQLAMGAQYKKEWNVNPPVGCGACHR